MYRLNEKLTKFEKFWVANELYMCCFGENFKMSLEKKLQNFLKIFFQKGPD